MLVGESPLWHPLQRRLFWIDIPAMRVHGLRPSTGHHESWKLPSEPGCIALSGDHDLVVPMRSGISILDTRTGALAPLVSSPPFDPTTTRFNDGRCDAYGRLWVGSIYEPRDAAKATLFQVDGGTIHDMRLPATVSNGVAFSPDSTVMYRADTKAHRIFAYDYDIAHGTIRGERLFKEFSPVRNEHYGGRPDGAAVDAEGAYWCAMFEGSRILRISPLGKVLDEVCLPVRCPTMVAFGGDAMTTLYITSASLNRPAHELASHPLSGCVLSVDVEVAGIAESYFRQ